MREALMIELVDVRQVIKAEGSNSDSFLFQEPSYTVCVGELIEALGFIQGPDVRIVSDAPVEFTCDALYAEPQLGGLLAFQIGHKQKGDELRFWEYTYHGVYVVQWTKPIG